MTHVVLLEDGVAESPYVFGGTDSHLVVGLGQGSAPPPLFGALSSISIGTYNRNGGGSKITSPYLSRVFLLAAVMYVDDMDLLHWAESPDDEDEELIESVQRDVKVWGETCAIYG